MLVQNDEMVKDELRGPPFLLKFWYVGQGFRFSRRIIARVISHARRSNNSSGLTRSVRKGSVIAGGNVTTQFKGQSA